MTFITAKLVMHIILRLWPALLFYYHESLQSTVDDKCGTQRHITLLLFVIYSKFIALGYKPRYYAHLEP